MKYCSKCGSPLDEDSAFCGNCGTSISSSTNEGASVSLSASFKRIFAILSKDKAFARKLGIFFALILVGVIGLIVLLDSLNTVKLVDYLQIEDIKGLNGYGTIAYKFDYEKLTSDVLGKQDFDYDLDNPLSLGLALSQESDFYEKSDALSDGVTITMTEGKNNSLTNGDSVKIKIDFESEGVNFGKKIKGGTVTYEVSGLENGKELDLFSEEYLTVSFAGINGSGKLKCSPNYSNWFMSYISYSCEKSTNLYNGDVVTLSLDMSDYQYNSLMTKLMEEGCVIPRNASKEYKVNGLTIYATGEEITKDFTSEIESKAREYFNYTFSDSNVKDVKLVGIYYADSKDKKSYYSNGYNSINVFFTYTEVIRTREYNKTINIGLTDVQFVDGKLKSNNSIKTFGTYSKHYSHSEIISDLFSTAYKITRLK